MPGQQALEETLCSVRISALLQQHIDNFAILVDRPPQVSLLTSDSSKDLIDNGGVAVALMPTPQLMRALWPESIAPKTNRLVGDEDASLSQQIFDTPMAHIEPKE